MIRTRAVSANIEYSERSRFNIIPKTKTWYFAKEVIWHTLAQKKHKCPNAFASSFPHPPPSYTHPTHKLFHRFSALSDSSPIQSHNTGNNLYVHFPISIGFNLLLYVCTKFSVVFWLLSLFDSYGLNTVSFYSVYMVDFVFSAWNRWFLTFFSALYS